MKHNYYKHKKYPYQYYQYCSIINNCNKIKKILEKKMKMLTNTLK